MAGIAGKGDAGRAGFAHVAEDHRLHVDRRAPFVRDAVLPAIDDRAIVVPGAEDRADRTPKLSFRVLREVLAGALANQRLEAGNEFLQIVGAQLRYPESGGCRIARP